MKEEMRMSNELERVLETYCRLSSNNTTEPVSFYEVADELGIDESYCKTLTEHLVMVGYLTDSRSTFPYFCITSTGRYYLQSVGSQYIIT